MDQSHSLEKRHGTHLHVETANIFVAVTIGLLVGYSLIATINFHISNKFNRLIRMSKSPIFLVLLWIGLCVGGIFSHFRADMLQIARRYGQLAIGAATITVVLSLKPSPLPQTFHAPLVSLHKWTGRTCIIFALVHGVIYSISFIKRAANKESTEHSHERRHAGHEHHAFSLFNVFGMLSLVFFIVILLTSLKTVRRRSYWLFYALHRPLVISIYVLMIWHARPSSTVLIVVGLSLLAAQIIARSLMTSRIVIKNITEYGPSLQLVEFECDSGPFDLSSEHGIASYIRLSRPIFSPIEFFKPAHPYTLAGKGKLVIRESRFRIDSKSEYCAYGPFKTSLDLSLYDKVLVIAGGSGISSVPSILFTDPDKCSVIWITRDNSEIDILGPLGITDCHVYITTGYQGKFLRDEEQSFELEDYNYEVESATQNEHENRKEIEEAGLLANADSGSYSQKGIVKHRGRPNFGEAATAVTAGSSHANTRVMVVTCGPESLIRDVQHWAQHHNYDYWTEAYAL